MKNNEIIIFAQIIQAWFKGKICSEKCGELSSSWKVMNVFQFKKKNRGVFFLSSEMAVIHIAFQ